MSAPTPPTRSSLVLSIIVLAGLAAALFWATREPLLPDPDDCSARGKPFDCWKQAYDEDGRVAR